MKLARILLLPTALAFAWASGSEAQISAPGRALTMAHQLTHSFNLDSAISPDGSEIVFLKVVEGREQLFKMRSDGTSERQITRRDADHEDPAWSPDGRKLAFVLIQGGRKIVHMMNPDGTGLEAITPATQSAIHPSWSPDGRTILYCTDDDLRPPIKNEAEIYGVDVATKKITTIISGGVNTYPVMSPDGSKIAYRKMLGVNSEVFVAKADGSEPRNLTDHPAFEGWPAWSPDGTRIAFGANRNANYQIFLMKADGSDVRLVANTEGRATYPRWSPDGRTIYFTNCVKKDFGRGCEILVANVGAGQ